MKNSDPNLKIIASIINCSLVTLISIPVYLMAGLETWKASAVALFFVYNLKTDFIEIRLLKAERDELKYQLAATIERCAQVADRLCCSKCDDIAAAIRALATKAESHLPS